MKNQTKQILNVYEYSKEYFNAPLKHAIAVQLNKRIKEINGHTKAEVLTVLHDNESQVIGIQAYQYVGVITINNKLVIQIVPKLTKSSNDKAKWQESIHNLLFMLNYTGKLLNTHSSSSQLKSFKGDFYEILIYLYASTLLEEIRNSLHHEYISNEQNLPFLKGKLVFNKHITKNSVSQHKFYLLTDEFDSNNTINHVFAYVCRMLLTNTANIKNRQLLGELNNLLIDTDYSKITFADAQKITINRLNQRFEPALNLAKLFLSDTTLKLQASNFDTTTFLIDMNVLFEDFIAKLVKGQVAKEMFVQTQGPHQHLVVAENNAEVKRFQMKPDITISYKANQDSNYHIIDTKYKLLDSKDNKLGISQADMYQMYAYSRKYNVKDITLLYPQNSEQHIPVTSYELDNSCIVHIKTIDICRDIKSNITVIKNDINKIITLDKVDVSL